MYFAKYGSAYLHDPRTDDRILVELNFEGAENEASTCSFVVAPGHPLYDSVKERDPKNDVVVYDDRLGEDDPYFCGHVVEVVQAFDLTKEVTCEGELAYLNDSVVRPYTTQGSHDVEANPSDYFKWLVETCHNSQVDARKRFKVDVNQASFLDGNGYVLRSDTTYPTVGSTIKSKLLDSLGGVIRVKYVEGERYIDYLREWEDMNVQLFDFGVNLVDYMRTDDALDLKTFVIPVGAKLKDTEYVYDDGYRATTDKAPVEGTEYFTKSEDGGYSAASDLEAFEPGVTYYTHDALLDESENALTVEALADGPYDTDVEKRGDMLYSKSAVEKYGWIGTAVDLKDSTDRDTLLRNGVLKLKGMLSPKRIIEVKGVDLSLINPDYKPIKVGEYVRVRSKPHGFDSFMLCSAVNLDLVNPENSEYTFGTTFDKLTGQQNRRINQLNATINKTYQDAASISQEAKQEARQAAKQEAQQAAKQEVANLDVYTKEETDQAIATESETVKSEVQDTVSDLSQRLDQTVDSVTESINSKTKEIEELQGSVGGISSELGATNARIDEVTGYIVKAMDSQGNPVIRMFTTANELEMWLTNEKMSFYDNGVEVAYVSGQKLFISQAEVTDRLDMGKYAWVPRSNGHLSLKYIG